MTDITMRQLLQAGVHFGHQTRYWSPSMAPYIFGDRYKVHIINLDKTLPMLKDAMNYIGSIASKNGKVLFVGTKRQAGKIIKEQAIRCGAPYVDHRWLGGMLTNFKTVKNSIVRLKDLEQRISSNALARLSKKEGLSLERECAKLDRTLSGIKNMNGLPDALFVIDVEHEYIAVAEANKLGIPVVAVVDSNCSMKGIDYVIPGNDDSAKAIALYLGAAADAIIESGAASNSMGVDTSDDGYVEIDASGKIKPTSTAKVVVKKSAAKLAEIADVNPPAQKEKLELKTVAAKKVIRKKITQKKVEAKDADVEETTKPKVTKKKVAKKKVAAKGTDVEKTTKSKVTKKKVAKKKVTPKTT